MEKIMNFNSVRELTNDIVLNRELELNIDNNKKAFLNVVQNTIDKGTDYVIRAMPVNGHLKDILIDVKAAFKTKDFKEILKTAINSSLREGLEVLNMPKNVISDITKIKDIAFKGGLREGISAGLDIVTNKYLKNNLFSTFIKDFINKTKDFVFSNKFVENIESGISKIFNKVEKYKTVCENWFKSYNEFDMVSMNKISNYLKRNKSNVIIDKECIKQNNIIQNMMELINNKKDKLSPIQLQICNNI